MTDELKSIKGSVKTAFFLALKDIFKDKKVTCLVVLMIAFSFVNLMFFTSFNYGMTNTMQDEMINTISSHLSIEPEADDTYLQNVKSTEKKLNLISGITASSPHIDKHASITYKGKTINTKVVGLTPSKEEEVTLVPQKIKSGEFLSNRDAKEIVLGKVLVKNKMPDEDDWGFGEFAKNALDVEVGENVVVTYDNGVSREYHVKGIIDAGMGPDFNAYVTTKEIEDVYNQKDEATQILVRLYDRDSADEYRLLIMQQGIRGDVKTWMDKAEFIEKITASMGIITGVMTYIGLLTVAATIAIIVYINTTHKRRLIGVLKAIGSKDITVLLMFLTEACIFSLFGIVLGIVLMNLITVYFSYNPMTTPIGEIYPEVRLNLVLITFRTILIAAVISGFYPAWNAAKQNIIRSIWGE